MYDFFDSYLPAYKAAFQQGNASGAMCSYNAENGHPSCANGWLLNEVLRKRWGKPDALITTDCGAVTDVMNNGKRSRCLCVCLEGAAQLDFSFPLGDFLAHSVHLMQHRSRPAARSWRRRGRSTTGRTWRWATTFGATRRAWRWR